MIEKLDRIVRLSMEIEGVSLLIKSRLPEVPGEALEMLAEKSAMLQAAVMELPYSAEPAGKAEAAPCTTAAADGEAEARAAEFEEEADAQPEAEAVAEPVVEPVVEPIVEPVAEPEPEPAETVEEKLAHERARDIFKAFTINDKFRFCRELFRGSESEFSETLETVASMSDFAEAEEYFFDDLCWDPDNDDVKAFMAVVKSHF